MRDVKRAPEITGDLVLIEIKKAMGRGDMKSVREMIDALVQIDMDALAEVDGIKIVERAEARPPGESCSTFIFGEAHGTEVRRMVSTWQRVAPTEGSVAVYLDKSGRIKHMGRVVDGSGGIVSKWGTGGHVFRHRSALVPTRYGVQVVFFKPQ